MSIERLKEDLKQVLTSLNELNSKPAPFCEIIVDTNQNSLKIVSDIAIKFTHKFLLVKRCGVLPYGVNHFVLHISFMG